MFYLFVRFSIINKIMPIPAIRCKFSFSSRFSNELAGASSGRSAVLRKNRALNLEAFHYYLGQNKLDN
jgi:hypothetical protein